MAEINNVIAEASQDLQTIEDFVNLPAGSDVRPRLLPSVNVGTLAGARQAIFEAGGLPATPFATRALMTASALTDGDYAQVTDDTVNNGLYVKTAGAWVKSGYDPVLQSESNSKSLINTLAKSDYFGKKFTEAEMSGSSLYSAFYVGLNSVTSDNVLFFNAIKARIVNASGSDVEYRIYTGATVQVTSLGGKIPAVNQNKHIASGICKQIASVDDGSAQTILLDKTIALPANSPFVIMFKAASPAKLGIAIHGAVTGNLDSRGVNLGFTDVAWGTTSFELGSVPAYTQAGFQLLLELEGKGAVTPVEPSIDYVPTLVMPPKIYTMSGLQAHIYPEHLLPESEDLYLHDVNCTKGKQVNRGWWWDVPASEAASTNALTWTLSDKQTGATLNSASTSVIVASPSKAGNKNVLVIGDSYINAGVITQRLLDISATDALKVGLIGTKGDGLNKHEGRGGWGVAEYTSMGRNNYVFTVSGVTTVPAINATIYNYAGGAFTVQETNISGGSGTLVCSYTGTMPTVGSAGTLTKANGSAGDATIAFSNVQIVSGNPFWFSGAVNFSQYITTRGLATPDVVLIQLGVNDSFGAVSDSAVVALTTDKFNRIDTLIASIKAQNSAVKIGIVSPPTYANQDAFGANYANDVTAWRSKRNIVIWNRELYAYFKNKEAQSIYVVAAGLNVDTQANFPKVAQNTNSHNATQITVQSNGVHPDTSGYKQIGDAMFAFIKAVA